MGALKGYKVVATMPKNSGIERGVAMKAFGAEVVLTDPAKGVNGAIKVAEKLHKSTPNSYMLKPFENPANTEVLYPINTFTSLINYCQINYLNPLRMLLIRHI